MSGILGIWNWDKRPVEPSLLAKMSGLIAHRGPDGEGRWLAGEVGFVFQNLWTTPESVGELQPLVCPGERAVLFDGRLDNREELFEQLDEVSRACSDAALVSAAYRKFGPGFAEKLNGDFAAIVYDIGQRRLFLARDAIGVRPLYFARAGEAFLVASEVKPIMAHPAVTVRPHAQMLAAYLLACFGQERQGWTFFDGVSSVLPGQMVTVKPGAISKRIFWDFENPQSIRLSNFEEYAEQFRWHFERAVSRRLRSAHPVAIAVSGGVDSSSVYCTAETLRRRGAAPCPDVIGASMEVEGELSDERVFLQDIEQKYGTRIHRIPSKVRFVGGSLGKGFRDLEAPYFRSPLNSMYPFPRAVRALGARVQITGQWGDQMVGEMAYLIDLLRGFRWFTAGNHLDEFARWHDRVVWQKLIISLLKDFGRYHLPKRLWRFLRNARRRLTSDRSFYTPQFWESARQAEVVQQFNPPGKTAYQQSIYALVRPMYYQQAMEWSNKVVARNGLEIAYPFFDRDLILFLLAIPGEVTCARGVSKAILRTAMRGILPETIAERRWKAQITRELSASMDRNFVNFVRYLERDIMCVQLGYVDEKRLKYALPLLHAGISSPTGGEIVWQLGDIFGLEFWLQAFWGTKLDGNRAEIVGDDENEDQAR